MKPELQIVKSLQRLVCTACGAEAHASCNCGKPYVPARSELRNTTMLTPVNQRGQQRPTSVLIPKQFARSDVPTSRHLIL
jgi:hypothetical protein